MEMHFHLEERHADLLMIFIDTTLSSHWRGSLPY